MLKRCVKDSPHGQHIDYGHAPLASLSEFVENPWKFWSSWINKSETNL